MPWQDATDEELRIKFGILNAYHFPDGDYRRLRQDISPVNSYRVLFGKLFGLDLPELPGPDVAFPDHPQHLRLPRRDRSGALRRARRRRDGPRRPLTLPPCWEPR